MAHTTVLMWGSLFCLLAAWCMGKDKNYNREKKRWMDAIHEDGSYWDHLILNRGDDVMDRYCIQGIPHIILIGPDGKILAKELRGEDLIKVPEKFVK